MLRSCLDFFQWARREQPSIMDPQQVGWVGGILGGLVGVLGGVVGSWASICNTRTPEARAYMMRLTAWTWVGLLGFLAALWVIPMPYKALLWVPYGIGLPLLIRKVNRRLAQLEQAAPQNCRGLS